MAIITSGDIKNKDTITAPTWPYNCEIDLNTKSINKLSNFPTVMKGDNNSVTIVIKAPLEYQGVDLSGTNCVLSYNTTWTDQEKIPSSGQIDLREPIGYNENDEKVENVLDDTVKYLTYSWTLDVRQTAEIGDCNFNITFLMNLDGDPFIDNVNIYLSEKEDDASGFVDFESTEIVEKQLRYWSFSTGNCVIPIGDPKTIIENNYNLILPNDIQSSVGFVEQKAAEAKSEADRAKSEADRAKSQADEAFQYSLDAANAVLNIETSVDSASEYAKSAESSATSAKNSENKTQEYKEAIVDSLQGYLFESGTTNGWYWRKYYDGTAICYKKYSINAVTPLSKVGDVHIYSLSRELKDDETIPSFLTVPGKGSVTVGKITAQIQTTTTNTTKMYVVGAEFLGTAGNSFEHHYPQFQVYAIHESQEAPGARTITVFVELIGTWIREETTNEN